MTETETVVPFPAEKAKKTSSHERIWGKTLLTHGYTGLPSVLIQAQSRLGVTSLQFNILVQLLDYWHDPARAPFPSKQDLADRIGCSAKAIQTNIRALEQQGLVRRVQRKAPAGDWASNVYDLSGLVAKVQALEPAFAEARQKRLEASAARKEAQLPKHRRVPKDK